MTLLSLVGAAVIAPFNDALDIIQLQQRDQGCDFEFCSACCAVGQKKPSRLLFMSTLVLVVEQTEQYRQIHSQSST